MQFQSEREQLAVIEVVKNEHSEQCEEMKRV